MTHQETPAGDHILSAEETFKLTTDISFDVAEVMYAQKNAGKKHIANIF